MIPIVIFNRIRAWSGAAFRVCLVATAVCLLPSAPANATPYLLFDAQSGEVLASNEAFSPWYPASLTKMMTAYVTFRAIKAGEITMDSPVTMTANGASEPPSKMGFKPGTVITVDTAIKIIIVKSANDVAMALGESVGGSEAAFVQRMNAEARRLGMNSTHFANPNGLPDDNQWTTARDYGLLARAILTEFPEYRGYFRITALALGAKIIKTHNPMLERYPGADGMKTGFICASGFNIVTSATRGNRQLVAVVLGSKSGKVRARDTAELLESGFQAPGRGLFSRKVTLDTLRPDGPVPSYPTNMRDQVCKKQADAGEDADADPSAGGEEKTFLVAPFHVMDPVPIYLGGAKANGQPVPDQMAPLPRPKPLEGELRAAEVNTNLPLPPEKPPITILGQSTN